MVSRHGCEEILLLLHRCTGQSEGVAPLLRVRTIKDLNSFAGFEALFAGEKAKNELQLDTHIFDRGFCADVFIVCGGIAHSLSCKSIARACSGYLCP